MFSQYWTASYVVLRPKTTARLRDSWLIFPKFRRHSLITLGPFLKPFHYIFQKTFMIFRKPIHFSIKWSKWFLCRPTDALDWGPNVKSPRPMTTMMTTMTFLAISTNFGGYFKAISLQISKNFYDIQKANPFLY